VVTNDHLDTIGNTDCRREVLMTSIGANLLIYGFVVQAIRLLIIFSITEEKIDYKMDNDDAETTKFTSVAPTSDIKSKFLDERYLTALVICITAFFCLFSVGAVATNKDNIQNACSSPIYSSEWAISLLTVAICFIVVSIKLRRVHDAYFIKGEFVMLTLLTVFISLPAFSLKFIGYSQIGQLVYELSTMACYGISIVIPTYMAVKEQYFLSSNDSSTEKFSSLSGNNSADISLQVEEETDKSRSAFGEHPRVAKFLADPVAHKFLRAYLLDFQDMRMSDYLNFWEQVTEFRKLNKEFLGGKGYLLYQKFLSKNAYRKIDCVNDVMRDPLESKLAKMVDGEEKIEYTFFDEVLDRVEEVMNDNLFLPFFHSKFYDQYKDASKLRSQMEKVQV